MGEEQLDHNAFLGEGYKLNIPCNLPTSIRVFQV